jgi:DNA-binding transcriptional ArsR family regulator
MKETFTSLRDFETSLHVNLETSKQAAKILRAINHPLRQQILSLIHTKGEVPVTEMYITLRIEQSVASMHLSILRGAGVVKTRRDGKTINYSINHEKLVAIQAYSTALTR